MDSADRKVVRTVLFSTYGKTPMTRGLAEALVGRMDEFNPVEDRRARKDMIRDLCWMWFSGGSTAESVAKEIDDALGDGHA